MARRRTAPRYLTRALLRGVVVCLAVPAVVAASVVLSDPAPAQAASETSIPSTPELRPGPVLQPQHSWLVPTAADEPTTTTEVIEVPITTYITTYTTVM